MCTWNVHIDLIMFTNFSGFFLFMDLVILFMNRNVVLKIVKNSDLNIENVMFLKWNFDFLFWFSTCRLRNIGNQDTRVWPYPRAWFFPIFNLCHTLWSKIIWFLNPLSNENFRKYFPVKQKRNTERSLNSAEIRIFHEHSESIQW